MWYLLMRCLIEDELMMTNEVKMLTVDDVCLMLIVDVRMLMEDVGLMLIVEV